MNLVTPAVDRLTPFVFEHAPVRGALVLLRSAVQGIAGQHDYPPQLQRALTELAAAAVLMASTLKFTGSLSLQLQGDGPVRLLVVECDHALSLRATAQWDSARIAALRPEATLTDLAGGAEQARFAITLDPGGAGSIYQGVVALEASTVAGLIEHYLRSSEQLASRILISADGDRVKGLLVQQLPTADDSAAWTRITAPLTTAAILADEATAPDTLAALWPEDDVRIFAERAVSYRCRCTRERVENALRIAGATEIEETLAERGDVEVICEFCNQRYLFTPAEARAVFHADNHTRH